MNTLPFLSSTALPTVASWRVADTIQTTLSSGEGVAAAVEHLTARELIPQAWADAMNGSRHALGPSYFSPAIGDNFRFEKLPSPSLLLALASHPERIDEAERLVRGALECAGSAHDIVWYPIPVEVTPCAADIGLDTDSARRLASLGVAPGGLCEGAVFLGVREAFPEGQNILTRHFVSLLLGRSGPGFGDVDSMSREAVLHSLLRSNRIPIENELDALLVGSGGYVPTTDCIGALQVFMDGLAARERDLLVEKISCFSLPDNANVQGAMTYAGLCLEEVIRTQKVLAKQSRETADQSGREQYARWLMDCGQDMRAYWYQPNVHRPKTFSKTLLFQLGLSERARRNGFLWSREQLTAFWDHPLPAVDFSPYRDAKHYEKAIHEFASKIAPKWEGAIELRFRHPWNLKVDFDPLKMLIDWKALGAIHDLCLDSLNTLSEQSIRLLAQSPASASLRALSLNDTNLGDESAIALSQSPYLNRLEFLSLKGTKVGSKGIAAIVNRTRTLPALKSFVC